METTTIGLGSTMTKKSERTKKDGNKIFEGKTEDIPEELKDMTYKNICFDGIDIVVEI